MATFFQRLLVLLFFVFQHKWELLGLIVLSMFLALGIGKSYQNWDDDPDRGAIAIDNGAFGESYSTPQYLSQGWSESDSLWFYNTTQGSVLLPYDFFLVLQRAGSEELVRSDSNVDRFRYLPQKATFFNPDAMPVGFAKETYEGKDYIGYTCAACHTGQVNYQNQAIRIDGGPGMADMVGFLTDLGEGMQATLDAPDKLQRFQQEVLALNNDFDSAREIEEALTQWTLTIRLYNTVNHSSVDYGYARLDAFGRIYNRVLQHVINRQHLENALRLVTTATGRRILDEAQIVKVLDGVGENILVDQQFSLVVERLASGAPGYPNLSLPDLLRVRNRIFNEPDAPVSYPFLWDIAQSDYVQWNGLANNAGAGPLGRNTGEVIGVFGKLDWTAHKPMGFNLAAWVTNQERKSEQITFTSSIDLINLQRLEAQLRTLMSPQWPEHILGNIDRESAARGQLVYANYCQSCHEVIERDNWDRVVVAKMSGVDFIGTDPEMARNSVRYAGKSGNLEDTVQTTDVGDVIIAENAPVVQILTAATKGVIATPDADKPLIRRWLDRLYVLGMSFFDNDIPSTIKSGNYTPDTTSAPYSSLLSYKGRSLNGIWATAPYLHNGSVPTLYDLLLPQKREEGDPVDWKYRPETFIVGSREFDPKKVGFRSDGYDGFEMRTYIVGNKNTGHEYGARRAMQADGRQLRALTELERMDLVEYLKTL